MQKFPLRDRTCITCEHCTDRNVPWGSHLCRRLDLLMHDEVYDRHGCILWRPDEWRPETQAKHTKKGTEL